MGEGCYSRIIPELFLYQAFFSPGTLAENPREGGAPITVRLLLKLLRAACGSTCGGGARRQISDEAKLGLHFYYIPFNFLPERFRTF